MKAFIGFLFMIIALVVLFFAAVLLLIAFFQAMTSNHDAAVFVFIYAVLGLLIGCLFFKMANGLTRENHNQYSKARAENNYNETLDKD